MFTEEWTARENIDGLTEILNEGVPLTGVCVELGCWEGRTSSLIANLIEPRILYCVDWFEGNKAEGADHPSVIAAGSRDVQGAFVDNMEALTGGNYLLYKMDTVEYLTEHPGKIAFIYVDAAHDYESVKAELDLIRTNLTKGGIACGDDYGSPGVMRAVKEVFPGHTANGPFWVYRNTL